ncbi:THAP domain-containing protein 10-like [Mercenaria mercenaria]|uniref:THAP domain-containing protein 10-like n=1 Tax=Mercenaria mercenaria TaxID=6596 RepID=UPI00234EFD57|nr:THAP domain-containing protein 10-like [Mercenaria mercenaria]
MPGAQCCVCGCTNKRGNNISLHQFPKDSSNRERWIKAVQATGTCFSRAGWSGPKSKSDNAQLVCSEHFEIECFTLTTRLHWKEGLSYKAKIEVTAIPTLFGQNIDNYKQKEPVLRSAFRKRECARI